jgi:hypothetical protein
MIRPGIVGVAVGIVLHDGEAAPDAVVDAGFPEARDLRPVEPRHQVGIGVHRQAVQRIFRKDHEVHCRHAFARLLHHRANLLGLSRQIALGRDRRQLQLNEPDHHAVRRLVQSAKSTHPSPPSTRMVPGHKRGYARLRRAMANLHNSAAARIRSCEIAGDDGRHQGT